jgi:HSP20 family protein
MVKARDDDRMETRRGEDQPRSTSMTRRGSYAPTLWSDPFQVMNQFADEMDRIFGEFGFGAGLGPASRRQRTWQTPGMEHTTWMPQIEVHERDNQLVVRADLPGMKKEDVDVDIIDDTLVIQGQRRQEQREGDEKKGFFRTERSYGRFYRAIPLPEGVEESQIKAHFHDGVLEVTVPVPERRSRGRRIEIGEGEAARGTSTQQSGMREETARAMREGGTR